MITIVITVTIAAVMITRLHIIQAMMIIHRHLTTLVRHQIHLHTILDHLLIQVVRVVEISKNLLSLSIMENTYELPDYMDLCYFGYDFDKESSENEKQFIAEIKERFPNVVLRDAFDGIKGYRQEVYLDKAENDNYYAWLFGKQWYEASLICQLMLMSQKEPEQKEKFAKYFALAKVQYPEEFKPEAL